MASSQATSRQRHPPNTPAHDDSWVDDIADQVQALLGEHGLDLELVVFYDKVTEVLHATGFDGSPARYFRSLESDRAPSDSPASRGNPMCENINNPEAARRETNLEASQ